MINNISQRTIGSKKNKINRSIYLQGKRKNETEKYKTVGTEWSFLPNEKKKVDSTDNWPSSKVPWRSRTRNGATVSMHSIQRKYPLGRWNTNVSRSVSERDPRRDLLIIIPSTPVYSRGSLWKHAAPFSVAQSVEARGVVDETRFCRPNEPYFVPFPSRFSRRSREQLRDTLM